MTLVRFHRGYLGLWINGIAVALGSMLLGWSFAFDGKGVTTSPAFDPARHVINAFGVYRHPMRAWGVIFLVVGAIALAPLTVRPDGPAIRRGYAFVPLAVLWLLFAAMFLSFAASHQWFGLADAIVFGIVAAGAMSIALTFSGYARSPRARV